MMPVNYFRDNIRGAEGLAFVKTWLRSLSPIEDVEKVNVPMLIVHGDVDQRVPVDHANKYLKELDKHGKSYKYVELEGADHFSNTLFYDHKITFYTALIDYLQNDCGPGGCSGGYATAPFGAAKPGPLGSMSPSMRVRGASSTWRSSQLSGTRPCRITCRSTCELVDPVRLRWC